MRKVILKLKGHKRNEHTGFFHGWFNFGDENGCQACGIIEFEDGFVDYFDISSFVFKTSPDKASISNDDIIALKVVKEFLWASVSDGIPIYRLVKWLNDRLAKN